MVCLVALRGRRLLELPMPSASVLATALSADSQSDSQSDSVPTPEATDSRRARALLIACITTALERFAFYTLVSLFVLYLVAISLLATTSGLAAFLLMVQQSRLRRVLGVEGGPS